MPPEESFTENKFCAAWFEIEGYTLVLDWQECGYAGMMFCMN